MDRLSLSGNPLKAGLLCLLFLATTAFAQNDPLIFQQQAIKRIDAFIDNFRKTGDMKSRIPDLVQADIELTESNRMFETMENWPALALGLIKQGHANRMQAQWAKSITLYQQAIEAAKRSRDIGRQAEALAFCSLAESSSQNLGQALTDATEAVRLAEMTGDKDIMEKSLGELGNVQLAQRDLDGAADTFNRQIETAKQAKDPSAAYYAYINRSGVYRGIAEQCDFQPKYSACYQALEMAKTDLQQAAAVAEKLGFTYLAQHAKKDMEYNEDRRNLIRWKEQSKEYQNPNMENLNIEYGEDNSIHIKNREQSKENLNQNVKNLGRWHPKKPSDVLISETFVFTAGMLEQKTDQALIKYQELQKVTKQYGGFAVTNARSYFVEGEMSQMQGKNDEALVFFLKAVDALEQERSALHDERNRGTYLDDKSNFYDNAIFQLLEHHRYSEAFAVLERSRSRALADLLAGRKLGLVKPEEQKLYSEMTVLRTRIGDAQGVLFEEASKPGTTRNEKKIHDLQNQIRILETEHDRVLAHMTKETPRLKNLAVSEPANLKTLQLSMREEGYEVLQYMVHDSGMVLWHISPDSIYVCNVFLPRSQVAEKVAALQNSIESGNAIFDETTAKELFLFLIQPVLERIKSKRLVIIPHEELNYIPFQTFLNPADGRFLGEQFQISYVPSVSILLGLRRSTPLAGGRLLAVADPSISFSEKEVQSIAKLFPERCKLVADSMPRECDVKTWVRDFDVVHLSVHGKFNAGAPMLSYLKLGEGGGDDGKLTAAEMYGLPLDKSKLVTFSACETGKAQATQGNEILGMVRGLLFAGANSLLLSSWRVDSEATALWMQTFYENALTRPLSEAAQTALVKVKGDPRYGHPRYWAAFTLIGR